MLKILLFVISYLLILVPVFAQDFRQQETICGDETAAAPARIEACSHLIDDAAYTDLADYATTHMHRASAYMANDANEDALADLNIALDYDPYLFAGYMTRGDVLLKLGENYLAIADFSVAAGINPLEAPPYAKQGLALFANNEYSTAILSLETALLYDINHQEARRTLIWILSTAPDHSLRDGNRALALIHGQADDNSGQQNQVILAAALAESGQTDAAMQVYRDLAETGTAATSRMQKYLAAANYYSGTIDGIFSQSLETSLRLCLTEGCRIGAPRP